MDDQDVIFSLIFLVLVLGCLLFFNIYYTPANKHVALKMFNKGIDEISKNSHFNSITRRRSLRQSSSQFSVTSNGNENEYNSYIPEVSRRQSQMTNEESEVKEFEPINSRRKYDYLSESKVDYHSSISERTSERDSFVSENANANWRELNDDIERTNSHLLESSALSGQNSGIEQNVEYHDYSQYNGSTF